MPTDLIDLALVGTLIVSNLGLLAYIFGQSTRLDRALGRAERAERLLSYRRPLGDVTVKMLPRTEPLSRTGLHRRMGVGQ